LLYNSVILQITVADISRCVKKDTQYRLDCPFNRLQSGYYASFLGRVERPKGKYKGQKLMVLVSAKIIAKTPKTIATVPLMVFVKYRIAITAATTKRRIRSKLPMFFFIITQFISVRKMLDKQYDEGDYS